MKKWSGIKTFFLVSDHRYQIVGIDYWYTLHAVIYKSSTVHQNNLSLSNWIIKATVFQDFPLTSNSSRSRHNKTLVGQLPVAIQQAML